MVEFGIFRLALFLSMISGVLKLYLILVWWNLGFSGLVLFFIEDVRCAEGIPDNIG